MYLFGKTIKKSKGMVYKKFRKSITSEGERRREFARCFKGSRNLPFVKLIAKTGIQFTIL